MKNTITALVILLINAFTTFGNSRDMNSDKFYIVANSKSMVATFADNSSAAAFRQLLAEAPLTVEMNDYGNFEKVGALGHTLPQNNTQITTVPGDVILYLGSNITIYYDTNSWSFTRLGKIDGAPTRESILDVLGHGAVNVTFSLEESSALPDSPIVDNMDLKIALSGRRVTVSGVTEDAVLSVYSADGVCVYAGTNHSVELAAGGCYLCVCDGKKGKILVSGAL